MSPFLRQPAGYRTGKVPWVAPAVFGFLALMAALFVLSYAVGSLAGPVAPGIQRPADGPGPGHGGPAGTGGMDGMSGGM